MRTDILKTEKQISFVKQTFQTELKKALDLTKVSSPIAIMHGQGINDELNGVERSVKFPIKALGEQKAVIVNSLAKWKRLRLKQLEVDVEKGIVTDMRAIRPDEDYSPIHSIYVDQWDWEKHMPREKRSIAYLKSQVLKIYDALKATESQLAEEFEQIQGILPEEITFIHTEELVQRYPSLTPKEREDKIVKQHGAVFLMGIGAELSDGKKHDGRAPDYDDWSTKNEEGFTGLNGDILLWNPVLEKAFEISSMGIRVDKDALLHQLDVRSQSTKKELPFHQMILQEQLPQSIGGGIGQSRVCMYFLRKKHIGEVQVGIWHDDKRQQLETKGIQLL